MIKPTNLKIKCVSYEINADWYDGSSDIVLLNLIGFKSNSKKYKEFLLALNELSDINILTIDYSGHGESPFTINDVTPAQNFLEVITAFDWITKNFPDKKIYVMGASYGGFLATQLTKYRDFEKLILRVPAIYRPENFYTTWGVYEAENGKKYRETAKNLTEHPLLKRASNFKGKTLVITHELDEVCPKNTTMAFIKAFGAEHWEAKGFKHGFGESDITQEQKQNYYFKVAEWIKK